MGIVCLLWCWMAENWLLWSIYGGFFHSCGHNVTHDSNTKTGQHSCVTPQIISLPLIYYSLKDWLPDLGLCSILVLSETCPFASPHTTFAQWASVKRYVPRRFTRYRRGNYKDKLLYPRPVRQPKLFSRHLNWKQMQRWMENLIITGENPLLNDEG